MKKTKNGSESVRARVRARVKLVACWPFNSLGRAKLAPFQHTRRPLVSAPFWTS